MLSWTLAFLLGVLLLQYFSSLPNKIIIYVSLLIVVLAGAALRRWWKILRIPIAILLGFTWILWYAYEQSAWTLPDHLEGKPITVTGYIASIPNITQQGVSFLFALKNVNNQPTHGKIRLMWSAGPIDLHAGDQWQLSVKLKKVYGTLNPGGFDYEAFAFQEGIRATGYVVAREKNNLLAEPLYHEPLTRIRQHIKEKIAANLAQTNTSPWITALTIGERRDIADSDWQVLRNTGTNHLMAIAGLHIGLMAALAHFIVARLWRYVPRLVLWIPAPHAGAIAALGMALLYSALAGFSLPTQRACLMLTVFLIAGLLRRHTLSWQGWCTALLGVLLMNPLSVTTTSFWLSFGSVALIIYGVSGRLSPKGLWWKWGRIQWVIAVGLIPLSIGLFQQFSLIAFVANSIAIPWVGCLVVPLCLLGSFALQFSDRAGGAILHLADRILNLLWSILSWFSHLPHVVWYQMVPHSWMLVAATIGIILLLLPVGFPGRLFSLIWLLPLILFKPATPKTGDVWLTLLDVGQGLSTVVQTQKHILVFDAGPRFGTSYDMGESVVVPFLHSIGATRVDMLIVSHGDNDHIGGANAVLHQFPVSTIKTSVPEKLPQSSYCLRGMSWDWDGVNFKFLHPSPDMLDLNNDSSCVLRVTSRDKHILLTGDIEKIAEKDLIENMPEDLPADMLIAPHHGSKTSASTDFVNQVNPHVVLFAVGYRNRYHFPHYSVVAKYQDLNAVLYDTVHAGAIQFQFNQAGVLTSLYRQQHKHYWNA
jgi:competence protein ComEC